MKLQQAFSLIEALIALSILSILLAIALPAFKRMMDDSNAKMLQSGILNAIQFARQEARARGLSVVFCKNKNDAMVFVDTYGDGELHDQEQILAVVQTNTSRGMIHARTYPYYHRGDLHFLPTGLLKSDNGTFWYCPAANESPAWAIMVSKSGKTRIAYPDRHGVIKDGDGKPLPCDLHQHSSMRPGPVVPFSPVERNVNVAQA